MSDHPLLFLFVWVSHIKNYISETYFYVIATLAITITFINKNLVK